MYQIEDTIATPLKDFDLVIEALNKTAVFAPDEME